MELNDNNIKHLIAEYKTNSGEALLNKIKQEIESYIYYFPKLCYRKSLDVCADFYLYMVERLDKVITNYPIEEKNLKFKTWFNYVLRNNFINFYKNQKDKTEPLIDFYDNNYINSLSYDLVDNTVNTKEDDNRVVHNLINNLDDFERSIIKLFYLPEEIGVDDVKNIVNHTNISIKKILDIRNDLIITKENDYKKTKKINEEIKVLNEEIMKLKYRLKIEKNQLTEESSNLFLKITRLENKKYKLLTDLKHINKESYDILSRIFENNVKKTELFLEIFKRKLRCNYLKLLNTLLFLFRLLVL